LGWPLNPAKKAHHPLEKERNLTHESRNPREKGGNVASKRPESAREAVNPLGCRFFLMGLSFFLMG
jgi:hypothetical protein